MGSNSGGHFIIVPSKKWGGMCPKAPRPPHFRHPCFVKKTTKAFTHGSTDKTVCLNYYLFQHKLRKKIPKNDCFTTINDENNTVFSYRFSPAFLTNFYII